MVTLRLGEFADLVRKLQRLAKIYEFKLLLEVMFVDSPPIPVELP
jgi:hypothetical protein